MNTKSVLRIFIVSFLFINCASNDDQFKNFCMVNNPVVDLEWLKSEIEEREQNLTESSKYYYISQSIYNDELIIIYANCDPLVNSIFPVFNCEGENIGFIGDENFSFEAITTGTIIWKTNDFACEF